jgi:hypothetical protein
MIALTIQIAFMPAAGQRAPRIVECRLQLEAAEIQIGPPEALAEALDALDLTIDVGFHG